MKFLDGFLLAVPAANKDKYLALAAEMAPIFREFGATRVVECWEDFVPDGKVTDMRRAVKATPDEVIVFSWIEYPNRELRDAASKKLQEHPRMHRENDPPPFDGMRMIWGGFAPLYDAADAAAPGYVEGIVLPVSTDRKADYARIAQSMAVMFRDHGALRVIDAWGDDVPDGKITDYRMAVNAAPGETIVFSWIEWPSKTVRDGAWEKINADPRMPAPQDMVGDMQRMIYGGFAPILDA